MGARQPKMQPKLVHVRDAGISRVSRIRSSRVVYCTTQYTVPLWESKLFISRSCPILVLTTVLGRPRRADVKKDVKNYQGPKKAFLSRF